MSYKNTIISNLVNGNWHLSEAQQKMHDKISAAVGYAWTEWDAEIIATYYKGEKPIRPTEEFITNWVENEDFEADGYDEDYLKELFN